MSTVRELDAVVRECEADLVRACADRDRQRHLDALLAGREHAAAALRAGTAEHERATAALEAATTAAAATARRLEDAQVYTEQCRRAHVQAAATGTAARQADAAGKLEKAGQVEVERQQAYVLAGQAAAAAAARLAAVQDTLDGLRATARLAQTALDNPGRVPVSTDTLRAIAFWYSRYASQRPDLPELTEAESAEAYGLIRTAFFDRQQTADSRARHGLIPVPA